MYLYVTASPVHPKTHTIQESVEIVIPLHRIILIGGVDEFMYKQGFRSAIHVKDLDDSLAYKKYVTAYEVEELVRAVRTGAHPTLK
jgi:hypothetical protein